MKEVTFNQFIRKLNGSEHKVILVDIETAPMLGYVWGLWQNNVALNQIHSEAYIMSVVVKILGIDEYLYLENRHNDSQDLAAKMNLILDSCSHLIAHNAVFDTKWLNSEITKHGLIRHSPYHVICTLKIVKQNFRLPSNKLEYVLKHFKCKTQKAVEHDGFIGFKLWKECLMQNDKAWEAMKHYNVIDVVSLEELYIKLRPWHRNSPAIFNKLNVCNRCGGKVVRNGTYTTLTGFAYQKYICTKCGGYSRDRKLDKSIEKSNLRNI